MNGLYPWLDKVHFIIINVFPFLLMKKQFSILFACVALVSVFFLSSCVKDEGRLPNISFKGGAGYTNANDTIAQNTTITIGINASKAEQKDVLKTFNASKSYDGGTATTFSQVTLSGADGDSYQPDFQITTRAQAGTEKYTFTVTNRDGLTNQVSLTLTVQ